MAIFFRPSQRDLPSVLQQAADIYTINLQQAEKLLSGHQPFTYLVRTSGTVNKFFLSFVRSDRSIEHLFFFYTNLYWHYENTTMAKSPTFESFIQKVMNCNPIECKSLEV